MAEVVAKGGSLLLGIGPKPDGTLPAEATERLEEIGKWTSKNGEAIYNTRITKDYHTGNTWFTQNKNGTIRYAIVCLQEGSAAPVTITWQTNMPKAKTKIKLLQTGEYVKWVATANGVSITLPKNIAGKTTAALVFAFTPAQ